MIYCPCCGTKTIWQSDFDAEDVYDDFDNVSGLISYYFCPNCDVLMEMYIDEEHNKIISIFNC